MQRGVASEEAGSGDRMTHVGEFVWTAGHRWAQRAMDP